MYTCCIYSPLFSDSDYSQSVNPSWLSMVLCGGTESSLSECSYSPPVGYTACSNTVNYAVVRCAGESH